MAIEMTVNPPIILITEGGWPEIFPNVFEASGVEAVDIPTILEAFDSEGRSLQVTATYGAEVIRIEATEETPSHMERLITRLSVALVRIGSATPAQLTAMHPPQIVQLAIERFGCGSFRPPIQSRFREWTRGLIARMKGFGHRS